MTHRPGVTNTMRRAQFTSAAAVNGSLKTHTHTELILLHYWEVFQARVFTACWLVPRYIWTTSRESGEDIVQSSNM